MDWFRSHHGAPTDPKWLVVARKAGVSPALVVATFWTLLDHASQQESRGDISGFDAESASAFLGIDEEEVSAILSAMEGKGITCEGRIANWEKRQRPAYIPSAYEPFRLQVYERDNYSCVYCGAHERLSIDHVIPQSKGGQDVLENLVTACCSCNSSKGAKDLSEWLGRQSRKVIL